MSAQTHIFQAYAEWRQWSQIERDAIAGADWLCLGRCHTHKARLQIEITRLTEAAKAECISHADRAKLGRKLRLTLQELIQFESCTRDLLAQARALAQRQSEEFDRVSANLERVHRSYGRVREPIWSSYS